jgi:hypothetical protein
MSKTPEEIQEFLEMNNIDLDNLQTNQSFKSNILLTLRNFKKLSTYLGVTLSFIKNLYESIDINVIVQAVLSQIETAKTVINVDATLNIGTSITQQIGTKIYRIERLNEYQVKITGDNILNWNVDNLFVTVKDFNGIIVYPTIVTINNEIHLYFNDIIGTNYKVILM